VPSPTATSSVPSPTPTSSVPSPKPTCKAHGRPGKRACRSR
jgi:hypothetical protein